MAKLLPNRWTTVLLTFGYSAFMVGLVLPVMQWDESSKHTSAGSARLFLGDGFVLTDGGFLGSALVPFAGILAGLSGPLALLPRLHRWAWRLRAGGALAMSYCAIWLVHVFVRKTEDEVLPTVATALLVGGTALFTSVVLRVRQKPRTETVFSQRTESPTV